MIDQNQKKQYEKDIDPKLISAKDVLRELRRKKNLENSENEIQEENIGTDKYTQKRITKEVNRNSLLSPFLGRHVRYLVVVIALFFISIVSFTYTLVDTSSFDNRNLADAVETPTIEFNSHSSANLWKTICYVSDSTKCNLGFITKNVLSIKPVNLPNFLKFEFDNLSQTGTLRLDYGTISKETLDKPTNISFDLISKVNDLNKFVNHQVIFTNGNYKDSNPAFSYSINYFTGECTNFPSSKIPEKTFENIEACLSYRKGMADNIFLVSSPTVVVDIANICTIDSSKTYKFEIPVEWSDSSNEISYIELKELNLESYIVPSFIDFRDLAIKTLITDNESPSKLKQKVVIGLEVDQKTIDSNKLDVPIVIYYPNSKSIQKEFLLRINFRLRGVDPTDASVDYNLGIDENNSNIKLKLNYKSGCRFVLSKAEIWDKYCSKFIETIATERIYSSNVTSSFDYPMNTLQKGEYCVKIFVRNSSEFNWKSFEIKNLILNSNKNSAPIILSKPTMTDISGNQQLNYTVSYSDFENDNIEIQFVNKPSWVLSSGSTITGVTNTSGSDLISYQLKDSSGNLSELQQFYVNSVSNAPNLVFDESELFAQSTEVQVSGNIKVKWSVSAYTTIVKQEIYFAKVGNPYTLLSTYNDNTTSSIIFNTRDYSDGKYAFKIKAYLDDGETVEQISSTYIFSNPIVTSSSNTTVSTTSVSTASTTVATTATANITSTKTIASTNSIQSSSAVTTEVSGSTSLGSTITSATILNQLPIGGSAMELSDLVISGKISFPEGKTYLLNSLKVFLNGEDISTICSVSEDVYQCSESEIISKLQNKVGLNEVEIAYADNEQVIYNQTIPFEIISKDVVTSSSISSTNSKVSAVDEEKVLVLFGRKVPNFVLYGFISIILILLLVFAIPWLLFFISERKMNNKVKKLASI